jgi:hypothetical protein
MLTAQAYTEFPSDSSEYFNLSNKFKELSIWHHLNLVLDNTKIQPTKLIHVPYTVHNFKTRLTSGKAIIQFKIFYLPLPYLTT